MRENALDPSEGERLTDEEIARLAGIPIANMSSNASCGSASTEFAD